MLACAIRHSFRLVFNNETLRSDNSPGVKTEVPSFGNTDAVEWLDRSKRSPGLYFAPVVEALVSWGYERGLNVAGAPFDWRKAPSE
jgi:lysophospholipase-3